MLHFPGSRAKQRRGALLALVAISLIPLLGFIALALDIGLLSLAHSDTQDAVDTITITAVRSINTDRGLDEARVNAVVSELITNESQVSASENGIIPTLSHLGRGVTKVTIGHTFAGDGESGGTFGFWEYDPPGRRFVGRYSNSANTTDIPTLVRTQLYAKETTGNRPVGDIPATGFGQLMGFDKLRAKAEAIAVHRPRDIVFVMDLSGSMKFGSMVNAQIGADRLSFGLLNGDNQVPEFGHYADESIRARLSSRWLQNSKSSNKKVWIRPDTYETLAISNYTTKTEVADRAIVLSFSPTFEEAPAAYATTPAGDQPVPNVTSVNELLGLGSGSRRPVTSSASDTAARDNRGIESIDSSTVDKGRTAKLIVEPESTGRSKEESTIDTSGVPDHWMQYGYGPDFKGWTQGPGYWGKTFFIWPPDPRGDWDWRKRFFTFPNQDYNLALWDNEGRWLGTTNKADINYTAIMHWIQQAPNPFPSSLRAGRIVYYESIPSQIRGTGANRDERFWKRYIDYVIGLDKNHFDERETEEDTAANARLMSSLHNDRDTDLAGPDRSFGPVRISKTPTSGPGANYMDFGDNPRRPLAHLWFGPLTMMMFISEGQGLGLPGTAPEAQTYQMKFGIQSALDSLQRNYPNDFAALAYFASWNSHQTSVAPMSQNFTRMRNALWFPPRTFDGSEVYWHDTGPVPRGAGGTNPEIGLILAFNQLSSYREQPRPSPDTNPGGPNPNGGFGRRGAQKLVILISDGVPNNVIDSERLVPRDECQSTYDVTFNNAPGIEQDDGRSVDNNAPEATEAAIAVIDQMMKGEDEGGLSEDHRPVRVHAFAFGDLFEADVNSPRKEEALRFLNDVQKAGKTGPLLSRKIITGSFDTRIQKLQNGLRDVFQDGISLAFIH